ncbi:hypothetical protein BXT89_09575 [Halopseudomonas pachastrellae]|uniref:Lipoprotein n=1 Tax=Halopseudomonas pachastrellae TaxID=254161 RepID=A0A1S8DGR8_9GAMM|nr:hypothetical protein [Halopseudomonas pachastrellae]ONM43986.1 hypothetical protein BXT89_09575 [Halopseudomonas pachastrellae]SFM82134.1 hypothetical protein SAMN05216256_12093 [Halopseudomonas pachastrellae]
MRLLIAFVVCFLALPVQACRGHLLEDTLFFDGLPGPQLEADVIARVVLSDVERGRARAEVVEVVTTSGVEVHEGQQFLLEYVFSSCGPNHRDGDQGMIIAKQPEGDERVLLPYLRRFSDGRITPPATLE